MSRKQFDLRTAAFFLLVAFFLILLLTHASTAAQGVQQGLSLCMNTLLPTLFPFLVLSELLISHRIGEVVGGFLQRPARFLLGISGAGAAALSLGILCGFPVGTSAAVSMYDRGEISEAELKRLFLFANNPSPGFLIGAAGGGLFGSVRAGIVLWGIVWGTALALGILLRIFGGSVCENNNIHLHGAKNPPSVFDLTRAVTKAFSTLLQVFAFVLFFSCITACLTPILHTLALPETAEVLLLGLPEMTAGIATAVRLLPTASAFPLTAFLAAFAGLSVCLQLFSVSEGHNIRLLPYLGIKLTQGGLSWLIATLYLRYASPLLCIATAVPTFAKNRIQQYSLITVAGIALLCLCLLVRYPNKKMRKEL